MCICLLCPCISSLKENKLFIYVACSYIVNNNNKISIIREYIYIYWQNVISIFIARKSLWDLKDSKSIKALKKRLKTRIRE